MDLMFAFHFCQAFFSFSKSLWQILMINTKKYNTFWVIHYVLTSKIIGNKCHWFQKIKNSQWQLNKNCFQLITFWSCLLDKDYAIKAKKKKIFSIQQIKRNFHSMGACGIDFQNKKTNCQSLTNLSLLAITKRHMMDISVTILRTFRSAFIINLRFPENNFNPKTQFHRRVQCLIW